MASTDQLATKCAPPGHRGRGEARQCVTDLVGAATSSLLSVAIGVVTPSPLGGSSGFTFNYLGVNSTESFP